MSNVFNNSVTRGGVEHTRIEAKIKAKGTTKIRGQGQPYRRQILSRPRTGMLEAKDQGLKRKCSPKKKVFTKRKEAQRQSFEPKKVGPCLLKILL